jgi:hypothetical protein
MSPNPERAAWPTVAIVIVGALLPFAPAVLGFRTLSHRDTDQLYAPVRTLVVEELRAGRLPLWNPYEATGKPLFAEGIHSVLHPISLAAAALAPASIDALILAYLVAAALGAFVLARGLGASPPASAGAALAFALSGFSASMTGNLVFLAGLSTLPWVVAAARAAGAGARWGQVAAALATACAFLSGDVQTALVGLALGALVAGDAGGVRGVVRTLAAMGAGVLLAGVQILATSEHVPRTYRSLGLSDYEKTEWALTPGRLLEWVVPGLFRGPLEKVPMGAAPRLDRLVFAESVFLGAPLLVAAALGTRRSGRRAGLLLGIAGMVLLWLAMGHQLGARQLLDWVPVWSRFRYSEKLMAPLTLCACALGALGVDAFGKERLSAPWRRALAAAGIAAAAMLAALLLAPSATEEAASRALGDLGPFRRVTLAAGLPHLVLGLAALLAADRLSDERARTAALALLVALAVAVAVRYGAHLGSPELRRFATPMRLEADPPTARIFHPIDRMRSPNHPLGAVDAHARSEALFLGAAIPVAHRVDTLESYGAFEPRRFETLVRSLGAEWARACRRYGLTHVPVQAIPHADASALAGPAIAGGALVQRDEALGFEVWAVPHRPWAFFAERAVAAERTLDARKALLDLVARGDDATVVVEASALPPTGPGRVLAVERGTGRVRVEAESIGPGLLVVQDAWWPGWRAAIDGQPAEILAADFLVRAVRWPPGRHRLEMTYDPPELRVGLAVSAAGAVLVVLLAVLETRRARRRSPQEGGGAPAP